MDVIRVEGPAAPREQFGKDNSRVQAPLPGSRDDSRFPLHTIWDTTTTG